MPSFVVTRVKALVALGLFTVHVAWAADFDVTSPGSFFRINGLQPNPTITLFRGETYTFAVSTTPGFHPFRIDPPPGTPGVISNNNISSGTITYQVATNAGNHTYVCPVHGFRGNIVTVPPPTVRIVRMNVSTNLTLRSLGTNNWRLIPQYSTNLATTNWFALTVETNRFLTGTNETICGRPAATNFFIRLRAQRN